jgi:hypothetical protein
MYEVDVFKIFANGNQGRTFLTFILVQWGEYFNNKYCCQKSSQAAKGAKVGCKLFRLAVENVNKSPCSYRPQNLTITSLQTVESLPDITDCYICFLCLYTAATNDISLCQVLSMWLLTLSKLRGSYMYHLLQHPKTSRFAYRAWLCLWFDYNNKQWLPR